jgi:uncharacterized membrane protein
MELLSILQAITGAILIFFFPGFLILKLFFKDVKGITLITLTLGISVSISILIGLILGIFKIFNYTTSIITYLIIVGIIIGIYYLKNIKKILR